jgi:hypothetical protein
MDSSAEWMAWFEAFAEAKKVVPGTPVNLALATLAETEKKQSARLRKPPLS